VTAWEYRVLLAFFLFLLSVTAYIFFPLSLYLYQPFSKQLAALTGFEGLRKLFLATRE
jgi:hypothetical protein